MTGDGGRMRVLVIGGMSQSLVNFRGPMLQRMVSSGHEVYACAGEANADITAHLTAMGVTFRGVELQRRGTNIMADWRYSRAISDVIAAVRPGVVLAYTIKPVIYGALAAARLGVPLVAAMITGVGAAQPEANLRSHVVALIARWLYAKALRKVNVVFFQNPDDEALFRAHQLIGNSRVVQIAGSGVDLQHFREERPITEPVTFLLIARLLANKGIREYVAAARILRMYSPTARCVLVGPVETGAGAIPRREVERWHDEGVIEYLGQIDDVRPVIASASAYVLPSHREGMPRTVLEAMAMGRAVITTDTPGCRETVHDGVNGYLVPVGDVNALAARMRELVDKRQLIAEMGLQSRRLAAERFDVNHVNGVIMTALGLQ